MCSRTAPSSGGRASGTVSSAPLRWISRLRMSTCVVGSTARSSAQPNAAVPCSANTADAHAQQPHPEPPPAGSLAPSPPPAKAPPAHLLDKAPVGVDPLVTAFFAAHGGW
eukprot:6307604-Alexandrium_andersonii.AAC.1